MSDNTILLSFCVDGTPVSSSGSSDFWPILAAVHIGNHERHVFMVGLFHGPSKPTSYNEYLEQTVTEMNELILSGINLNNKLYTVHFKCFIADAPALASIKNIKSHGGYSACSKCDTRGENVIGTKKIVYPELNSPLRTDNKFRQRKSSCKTDEHHMSTTHTILETMPIDMVDSFPLDKMHLVDEGVVKKILVAFTGKANSQKLSARQTEIINNRLTGYKKFWPLEFQRKPRSLTYVAKMKATEFR